jgi:hypothetical protein
VPFGPAQDRRFPRFRNIPPTTIGEARSLLLRLDCRFAIQATGEKIKVIDIQGPRVVTGNFGDLVVQRPATLASWLRIKLSPRICKLFKSSFVPPRRTQQSVRLLVGFLSFPVQVPFRRVRLNRQAIMVRATHLLTWLVGVASGANAAAVAVAPDSS